MSIIQATRSVANIMNIDAYKLNTASIGEDIVVHQPNPTLGRHSRETWKVMRKIGQGGFGSVWLEKEQGTGALRAVKKIYLEKSRNFPYSRELNALIKVWNHRELFVRFLGWYEKTDFVFVTMEYLENGDLEKYLKSSRLKAKSEAKEIATQLLEGLKVLHENKICHRDLKPNNILIARYSPIQVKLADFGSSKSTINTSLRTSCGTSGYMAPELLKLLPSKKRYTNSLDIWSLGCVIHEILTSELPFLQKSEDTDSSANSSSTIRDPGPACSTPEADVDIGILMSFCQGKTHFPEDVLLLAGVSVVGIDFLKSLLAANPALRMSASEALQSRDTWFFEMREELHQEDSPYILKEQFYSLGIVLSSSVINSLITQCKMRRGFDVKCTDLGSIPFLTNVIYEAIKRGYNLIIEMLLPLLLPGVDVCIYVDAVVKCGSIKTMISVLRGASLVDTKKFCQMALHFAAGLGYPAAIMPLLSWGQLDVDSKTEYGETALNLAAKSGHHEVVALLLERGADVESRTETGETALNLAAKSGHHEVVALLLERGADVDPKMNDRTALHLAAGLGYHKVVALFLDRGADIESKTEDGTTALHSAAESGYPKVVALLLDRGACMESKTKDGETALHLAAGSGHLEVVVLLLDRGAGMESKAGGGAMALHLAAGSGYPKVVALLLDKGAGMESRAGGETTALHLAAGLGHLEVVALLLDRGANMESKTGDGETALHLAAESGQPEVVALLLDRGANMKSTFGAFETALHLAAESGHPEVVALLLDRGASMESRTFEFSKTALHLAAGLGHLEVVALLLGRGADMESKTGDGETALHLAAGSGHLEVVALLLDRGADMESRANEFSKTPLHLAAGSGYPKVVALLLDRGANKESTFGFFETALDLAAESGHLEVVALLLDRRACIESTGKIGDGTIALHLAAGSGHPKVAALLLDRGVDMESTFGFSETALHLAAGSGHLEVVALLLDRGADMESRTFKFFKTALHLAAGLGHLEVVALLLGRGANMESKTVVGETALHLAAGSGHLEVVALLLDRGADMESIIPQPVKTPLHSAAEFGRLEVVALLLDRGASMESKTKNGETALLLAVRYRHSEVALLLRNRGANLPWVVSHASPREKRRRVG